MEIPGWLLTMARGWFSSSELANSYPQPAALTPLALCFNGLSQARGDTKGRAEIRSKTIANVHREEDKLILIP